MRNKVRQTVLWNTEEWVVLLLLFCAETVGANKLAKIRASSAM